jgi:hypothetical protein
MFNPKTVGVKILYCLWISSQEMTRSVRVMLKNWQG